MRKKLFISYSVISILLLLFIEQGLEITYTLKTIAKIFLLLGIPLLLFRKKGFSFLHLRKNNWSSWKPSLFCGITIMLVIVLTFVALRPLLDLNTLLFELAEVGVTATVFPLVALYILFGNSILEEFFFRGLLPSSFSNEWLRILIPSLLFALYHITIFLTWFSLPLLTIVLIGLWIGGIIFQLVNKRSKTILPSWTIHVFADAGILLIGVYLFYFY